MDLVNKLKADNKAVYVEIQGHTDAREPMSIGQRRAEAVRAFMNQQGVALNRMQTIDYGKEMPVASNTTRDGRAQNRCVVLVVLA
jgi:outer membrane protein OmpA-like peptidoglycan-associated protein